MSDYQPLDATNPLEEKIEKLERSVEQLIKHCEKLTEDNNLAKHSYKQIMLERSELQSKNEKVRAQVEAMVERLKAMEKTS